MNVLVTGGTGLIGKRLVSALLDENTNITVLTRNIDKATESLGSGINLITALTLADIENADTVINLAGEPIADKRWSAEQKNKICQSRWQITEQLCALIKQANNPPSVFISGSAIGMYGRQSNEPKDESFTHYYPEFTHEVCATWEEIALSVASDKTRVAILRTGVVLDAKGGALAKMLLPFKLGLGGKISSGKQMMSWVHIDDMVAAILFIQQQSSLSGAINITSEHPVSNQEFSSVLASTLNRPCIFTTPAFIFKILFGEMADLLLFGQCVIPGKLKESGFVFKYPTIESALTNLLIEKS